MWDIIFENIEAVFQRCSVKKVFFKNSQNSQENTCARVSYLIKLQALGLKPATLLNKRLWHRRFPVNFLKFRRATLLNKRLWHWRFPVNVKFLRTPFYTEHLWWLLLKIRKVFMQKEPSRVFFKKGVLLIS